MNRRSPFAKHVPLPCVPLYIIVYMCGDLVHSASLDTEHLSSYIITRTVYFGVLFFGIDYDRVSISYLSPAAYSRLCSPKYLPYQLPPDWVF